MASAPAPATVARATYMGSHTEYVLASDIGELFATMPEAAPSHAKGDRATVAFATSGVVIVAPS